MAVGIGNVTDAKKPIIRPTCNRHIEKCSIKTLRNLLISVSYDTHIIVCFLVRADKH